MADPTNAKDYMFFQKSEPASRWGGLIEGPPKPKGKIRNPKNFTRGGPIWVMENATFFSILASMGKTRNTFHKEALKL
jgi:hypothetical protein